VTVAAFAFLMASGILTRTTDSKFLAEEYERPKNGCFADGRNGHKINTVVFAPCEVIGFPGRPVVFLVGDSHSYSLYQGLRPYLDARQINLIEYTVVYCLPLSVTGNGTACAGDYKYILDRIERDKPDLVILSAHHLLWSRIQANESSTGYEKLVATHMAELLHSGARNVLIVGQVPIWNVSLPRIINQHYLRYGQGAPIRMFTGLETESIQIDDTMRSASAEFGVPYYSLKNQLCGAQGCLTRVGEKLPEDLIVFDDGHLTTAGARYVLESGLGERIDSLLAGRK
jgi:hypothetical protein